MSSFHGRKLLFVNLFRSGEKTTVLRLSPLPEGD